MPRQKWPKLTDIQTGFCMLAIVAGFALAAWVMLIVFASLLLMLTP